MRRFVTGALLILVLVPAMCAYIHAKLAYDPDRVCAQQTDMSHEECMANVEFVSSAGW